jgi:hypothetical protein
MINKIATVKTSYKKVISGTKVIVKDAFYSAETDCIVYECYSSFKADRTNYVGYIPETVLKFN